MIHMAQRHKSQLLLPATLTHRVATLDAAPSRSTYWLSFGTGIGLLLILVGAYVAYLDFGLSFPTASLAPLQEPLAFASTPFTITNSGLVDIRGVQFSCDANRVNYLYNRKAHGNAMSRTPQTADMMRRNETLTVTCPFHAISDLPASGITSAEIDLHLTFNGTWPLTEWTFPYASKRTFRYCGTLDDSGHSRWFAQPDSYDCFADQG